MPPLGMNFTGIAILALLIALVVGGALVAFLNAGRNGRQDD